MGFSRQEYWSVLPALLQGIFPTWGSNPHLLGLLHWQVGSLSLGPPRKPWRRRQWHPTPVLLPGKSHGRRSLVGCSPWGLEESDTTERLHFHFSLSCIGEGNGNPLQCSCLENPRDRWAAVYGVTQSWTRLKRLSSSSSSSSSRKPWIKLCSHKYWMGNKYTFFSGETLLERR